MAIQMTKEELHLFLFHIACRKHNSNSSEPESTLLEFIDDTGSSQNKPAWTEQYFRFATGTATLRDKVGDKKIALI